MKGWAAAVAAGLGGLLLLAALVGCGSVSPAATGDAGPTPDAAVIPDATAGAGGTFGTAGAGGAASGGFAGTAAAGGAGGVSGRGGTSGPGGSAGAPDGPDASPDVADCVPVSGGPSPHGCNDGGACAYCFVPYQGPPLPWCVAC